MNRKKYNMAGLRGQQPVDSFIEQAPIDPFTQDRNPSEFVAETGGMRELKKKQKEDIKKLKARLKKDKKADKEVIRNFRKSQKIDRDTKKFTPPLSVETMPELTKSERKEWRKATRRSIREYRRQERKARRGELNIAKREDKLERKNLKNKNKLYRRNRGNRIDAQVSENLEKLNKSESSSKLLIGPKNQVEPVVSGATPPVDKTKTDTKTDTKLINLGVTDAMTFSEAFRTARDNHGGKGGEFTHKGKKYHTGLRSEFEKADKKETATTTEEDLVVVDDKQDVSSDTDSLLNMVVTADVDNTFDIAGHPDSYIFTDTSHGFQNKGMKFVAPGGGELPSNPDLVPAYIKDQPVYNPARNQGSMKRKGGYRSLLKKRK